MKFTPDSPFTVCYRRARRIVEAILHGEHPQEFQEYVEQNRYADALIERLSDPQNAKRAYPMRSAEELRDARQHLLRRIDTERRRRKRVRAGVLSVGAGVAACGLYWFLGGFPSDTSSEITPQSPMLICSDGSQIDLNAVSRVNNPSVAIEHLSSTSIRFHSQDSLSQGKNTLVVPAGYTYSVILPDSSCITLNAGSRLEYPSVFSANVRKVHLQGEAYFEITRKEIPFVVEVGDLSVKVYGTAFNIKSSDELIQTVLIHGSVGVQSASGEVRMKPNQIYRYDPVRATGTLQPVDGNQYVAWREGYFDYSERPLSEFLADLARWYGIKIELPDHWNSRKITIYADKNTPLHEVLSLVEMITDVTIKKKGGQVYQVVD